MGNDNIVYMNCIGIKAGLFLVPCFFGSVISLNVNRGGGGVSGKLSLSILFKISTKGKSGQLF